MTIESDFAELQHASELVAEIADLLRHEKSLAHTQVEALTTAGWEGEAASQYAAAWRDWADGADRVLDALRAESSLLAAQRADFQETDGVVSDGMTRLHGRLGAS
ncbi:WXG100 family type VII secretion target [Nocardioides mangrovi]|uniref:WXG100 family type VII secretion target n=1 Tax=Nocardioides mangrovi TaxID=2874580 RepID=A0ABS7UGB2_9ACTN|nr:WXG100 family type VII secretion target [Nocardioides mangrovi]MBZ5739802.1 WXG100 family type VII secretion target [Nocardioides mangrovi]